MQTDTSVSPSMAQIEDQIQEAYDQVDGLRRVPCEVKTAAEFEALERKIVAATDRLAGLLVAKQLQTTLEAPALRQAGRELAKRYPKPLRDHGEREVELQLVRGGRVRVRTVYFRGKARRRGRPTPGLYPGLLLLGIQAHCTPAVLAEVGRLVAALGSFQEASGLLHEWGIALEVKCLRRIAYGYAAQVRAGVVGDTGPWAESLAGARVVISTDGGRVRIREDKRGPRTRKGRRRYHTEWREPKLLQVYVVDAQGKKAREVRPWIDGTLKGPAVLMMLLEHYLRHLGVSQAAQVLVVADGARWIWTRLPQVLAAVGLKAAQVYELVDFYHAVEHLGTAAALCKSWSAQQRRQWITKQRRALKHGRVAAVITAVAALRQRGKQQELSRERDFFVRNRHRMDYAAMAACKLPLGSGAMESAIRRVVNLRLKGAGIFWHEESAEAVLLLRSYYKAGRWEMVKKLAAAAPLQPAA